MHEILTIGRGYFEAKKQLTDQDICTKLTDIYHVLVCCCHVIYYTLAEPKINNY